jgi:hypothetical protein
LRNFQIMIIVLPVTILKRRIAINRKDETHIIG